ncbi:hypothetical protein EWM64_g146 [Hericium alpestre]|uniref:Uncharacterized protein n=1 Tax=Hericium alpestre TaxID=135208 RepID=A0A4Z0A9W6_9AGAM|nr:hypothetical protein EWM64_g146 [Hericium alpestre]
MASSDTPYRRHSKERRRSRSTDEAHVFKKPVQVVRRPLVTDHNISEDYMRNPPDNFDPSLAEAWTAESEGPTERQMRAEERVAANLRATEKEEREEREEREKREAEVEKERSRGKSPGRSWRGLPEIRGMEQL